MLHRLLDKYSALFTLALLALTAYGHAWGVSEMFTAWLSSTPARKAPRPNAPRSLARRDSADLVLHHAPFEPPPGPLDDAPSGVRLADLGSPPVAAPVLAAQALAARVVAPPALARSATLAPAATDDLEALTRGLRFVPEQRDGKALGVRLFGVRPNNVFGMLGLENGDRVESINGYPLATPQQALEAYPYLRTATRLEVAVNRHGKEVRLRYLLD